MIRRRHRGFTVAEMLVATVIIGLIIVVLSALLIQGARVYAITTVHFGPQSQQMTAMRRLQRDLRQALQVQLISETQIKLIQPQEHNGLIEVTYDETTKRLRPVQATQPVSYFLGPADRATPQDNGRTLYRAVGEPQDGVYADARVILREVCGTCLVPNPAKPAETMQNKLFSPSVTGQQIVVTLTIPVVRQTRRGRQTVYHTLSTQYYARNVTAGE